VDEREQPRIHDRWAQLRFSVIGQLLASPPRKGALRSELQKLAEREWRHPATGEPVRFAASTIERWYYRAVKERHDPVRVLRRKVRADAGHQIAMSDAVRKALLEQYAAHKSWSVKLHHDNLVALAEISEKIVIQRLANGDGTMIKAGKRVAIYARVSTKGKGQTPIGRPGNEPHKVQHAKKLLKADHGIVKVAKTVGLGVQLKREMVANP
jgi:hypothetical protein